MRPARTTNETVRLTNVRFIDLLYAELVEMLEDCANQGGGDCDCCPYWEKCWHWWKVLCGKLEDRMIKDADFKVYVAEFKRIRNNGDNTY